MKIRVYYQVQKGLQWSTEHLEELVKPVLLRLKKHSGFSVLQRKESKEDLRQQHHVSIQGFETYHLKNSITHRGSNVWNLLEPSALSARDYAKRAKKVSHPQKLELYLLFY